MTPRFYVKRNENDMTSAVGDVGLQTINENKNMNGLLTLDWLSIKRALAQGVVTGIVAGIAFILKAGSIFGLDLHSLVDVIVLATLATLPSLATSLLTTHEGNVVGAVKVE